MLAISAIASGRGVISAISGTFKPVVAFTNLGRNLAINLGYRNLTYPILFCYGQGLRPPIGTLFKVCPQRWMKPFPNDTFQTLLKV